MCTLVSLTPACMRTVYGLMGIVILAVAGWMFLSDYLLMQETNDARAFTVDDVKLLGAHGLPRFFVLKDAVRKNLASVGSSLKLKRDGQDVSTDLIYPVYGREEAMDTSFNAMMKNEAVVFVSESMKTDTTVQVFELFQPVSYRVRNTGATLTDEERRLFDEQDILVSQKAFKLGRDYGVVTGASPAYALICFAGIGILAWSMLRRSKPNNRRKV